jgi:hypothetical protein
MFGVKVALGKEGVERHSVGTTTTLQCLESRWLSHPAVSECLSHPSLFECLGDLEVSPGKIEWGGWSLGAWGGAEEGILCNAMNCQGLLHIPAILAETYCQVSVTILAWKLSRVPQCIKRCCACAIRLLRSNKQIGRCIQTVQVPWLAQCKALTLIL